MNSREQGQRHRHWHWQEQSPEHHEGRFSKPKWFAVLSLILLGMWLPSQPSLFAQGRDVYEVLDAQLNGLFNAPVPQEWLSQPYLMTSYQEDPKYLDSASSYSNNETPWTYAVYEPPLKYHYLKRPYELMPRTLVGMPQLTFLGREGRDLKIDADHLKDTSERTRSSIAQTVFELHIKPGILFQPHPAFYKNDQGQLLNLSLTPKDLEGIVSPWDFKNLGSRELTAADYAYAIKRLANPRINSPAFGFLSSKILGFDEFGQRMQKESQRLKSADPSVSSPRASPKWMDFRKYEFEGVKVIDPYTLQIKITGLYPQFKYWLAMTFFAPVAWEVDAFYAQEGMAKKNLSANTWPVGTGPFMLTEHDGNAKMVLSKNPNYRGEPYPCEGESGDQALGLLKDCGKTTPFLDKIISIREKEGTSVATKFIQGYYDMPQMERGEPGIAYQVSIQDGTGLSKELKERKIQLPTTIQVGFWHYGFNWLDPIVGAGKTPEQALRNKKLRQAIAIAFDFEEYVSIFENSRAQVNHSVVVPGLFGNDAMPFNPVVFDAVGDSRYQRKSIEKAKRLLAEAGYPGGIDQESGKALVINYDTQGVGPGAKTRIDWVSKQFAKLNIQLEVRNTDYNRFQDKMRKGSAQFFFWGWLADYPDPENFLFLLYGPNSKTQFGGENSTNFKNAQYDQLFEKMKDMENTPERAAIIKQMMQIMQDESPMLFGWSEEYGGAYHQWVRNGKPSNIIRDQMSYLDVDAKLRVEKIRAWNQPIWWPLLVLPILIGLMVWPALMIWRKRQSLSIAQNFKPRPSTVTKEYP